jgi:hypothetical protein
MRTWDHPMPRSTASRRVTSSRVVASTRPIIGPALARRRTAAGKSSLASAAAAQSVARLDGHPHQGQVQQRASERQHQRRQVGKVIGLDHQGWTGLPSVALQGDGQSRPMPRWRAQPRRPFPRDRRGLPPTRPAAAPVGPPRPQSRVRWCSCTGRSPAARRLARASWTRSPLLFGIRYM